MNPFAGIAVKVAIVLAIILAGFGLYAYGEHQGDAAGASRVQVKWDLEKQAQEEARAANLAAADASTKALQAKADTERTEHAKDDAARERLLAAALDGLRHRPARPADPKPGGDAPPPGAGPAPVCTGAELYRDDAEFLTRLADKAQAIREQRDAYRERYEDARKALEALGGHSP